MLSTYYRLLRSPLLKYQITAGCLCTGSLLMMLISGHANGSSNFLLEIDDPAVTNAIASHGGTLTRLPTVSAFLDTIAWAETGTAGPSGYRVLVFNGKFNDFATHPKKSQCTLIGSRNVCSDAAGRYQVMSFNWDRLVSRLHLKDFGPESQDAIALQLIREKGALRDVIAGRFDTAAYKVGGVWASFPNNSYGQNPKSLQTIRRFYEQQLAKYQKQGNG